MATDERERVALDQLHQALRQKERFDALVASAASSDTNPREFRSARDVVITYLSLVASLDRTALADSSRKDQVDALVRDVSAGVNSFNEALRSFVDGILLPATLEEEFAPLLALDQADLARTGADKELARLRRNADWEGDGWAVKEGYAQETKDRLVKELRLPSLASLRPHEEMKISLAPKEPPATPPPTSEQRRCPSCNAEMGPGGALCPQCGGSARAEPVPAPRSATPVNPVMVLVIVILVIAGFVYIAVKNTEGPSEPLAQSPADAEQRTQGAPNVAGSRGIAEDGTENAELLEAYGTVYLVGDKDTPKDLKQAHYYLAKAAALGRPVPQYNLGVMYRDGVGVEKDLQAAASFFRAAAAQGHARAQNNLAAMLVYGEGIPKNHAEAIAWYGKAAAQGEANAQDNLGLCYAQGIGTPIDIDKAEYWFRKAMEQGAPNAESNLRSLQAQRSASELPVWTDRQGRRVQAQLLSMDETARYVFRDASGRETRLHYSALAPGDHIRASKELLQSAADAYVQKRLDEGSLLAATARGVVVVGEQGIVGYEFTFRTEAGLTRTNPKGSLYFYLDEKRGWINSDVVIDGLPRY